MENSSIDMLSLIDTVTDIKDGLILIDIVAQAIYDGNIVIEDVPQALSYAVRSINANADTVLNGLRTICPPRNKVASA